MLMKMEITNRAVMLVRIFRNQSSWDTNALQMIMVQPAHHWGPNARRKNEVCSKGFPLYQAMKYSMAYAYSRMDPVKSVSFAKLSKWYSVIRCSILRARRR